MVNQNLNGHIRVDHMLYHQPTVRGLFNYVILSAVLSNHSVIQGITSRLGPVYILSLMSPALTAINSH